MMMNTKRQYNEKRLGRILVILQLLITVLFPLSFYMVFYGSIPFTLTPFYVTASFVFVLYRKNKLLNSFLLTSILPMLFAFFTYGNVVHVIPIVISIIIFLEKEVEMNSFLFFSVLSFTIYIIDVFIGVYQHVVFGNLLLGTLVFTLNILLVYYFFTFFRPESAKNRKFSIKR